MRYPGRQRLVTLILAIAAVALTAPLWASRNQDRNAPASVAEAGIRLGSPRLPQPVAEAGSLVLTGGFLIGLASVVRRSS
jgi:hypothetical protein